VLGLLKFLLQKLDVLSIAEAARKRNNRRTAAQLHLILVLSYEIIELYEVLLNELRAALETYDNGLENHSFSLNRHRVISLLQRQSSNLAVMEKMTCDLLDELRIVDNNFADAYRAVIPGKGSILFHAEMILADGRFPLAETGPGAFPAGVDGKRRALSFNDIGENEASAISTDRSESAPFIDEDVVEINIGDVDAFFVELKRYLRDEDPIARLSELQQATDRYREVLLKTFKLEDILGDISSVKKYDSWAP